MASLIDELVESLEKETKQYERLISLNDEKKDSIIYQKIDVLERITAAEQEIADSLLDFERERADILKKIAGVMGKNGEEITVSWMIDNLGDQPVEQQKLMDARSKLVEVANKMQTLNIQNQNLLKQALEMVEFDITLLKSSRQAPQTSNYGKDAFTTGNILGGSGFDAKQ